MSFLVQRNSESRAKALIVLVHDAERRLGDLSAMVAQCEQNVGTVSASQLKEKERMLGHWEFRHKLFKRMKQGYDHASKSMFKFSQATSKK